MVSQEGVDDIKPNFMFFLSSCDCLDSSLGETNHSHKNDLNYKSDDSCKMSMTVYECATVKLVFLLVTELLIGR